MKNNKAKLLKVDDEVGINRKDETKYATTTGAKSRLV
jgi:hypothetical protein